jgi:hypothetical protein
VRPLLNARDKVSAYIEVVQRGVKSNVEQIHSTSTCNSDCDVIEKNIHCRVQHLSLWDSQISRYSYCGGVC